MSRNEALSQLDPTGSFPVTKFEPFTTEAVVQGNRLLVTDSAGTTEDLGDFRLASAVYIVDGYLDADNRAVVIFSDGQEVVLNKITNDQTFNVTLEGTGYLTGNDKSKLEFAPVETNFPMTFNGETFSFAQANDLKPSQYARLENRGPLPSGRFFTTWTPIDIRKVFNPLGLVVVGNTFTLPAGEYYIKITGQHYRGTVGFCALINATNGQLVTNEAISVSHSSGSAALCLMSQKLTIPEPVQVYFGFRCSTPQHTSNFGLGVSMGYDTKRLYDIYNYVEIWRLND